MSALAPDLERHDRFEAWSGSILEMFRAGLDTREIASMRWKREAHVLRELTVQRSARLGLPNPFEAS